MILLCIPAHAHEHNTHAQALSLALSHMHTHTHTHTHMDAHTHMHMHMDAHTPPLSILTLESEKYGCLYQMNIQTTLEIAPDNINQRHLGSNNKT